MEHAPHGHVVVCDQCHALADDGLALFLVIVVIDDVEHTVQEGDCWLDLIDNLEDLPPAVSCGDCLTQADNLELVGRLVLVDTGQTADSVLDCDGVILGHLGVYVEHHRLLDVAQLIAQMAQLSFDDAGHELAHECCFTMSGLSLDDVQISYLSKGHSVVTECPARRHVGLGKVQIETLGVLVVPVITLKELRYVTDGRDVAGLVVNVIIHSSRCLRSEGQIIFWVFLFRLFTCGCFSCGFGCGLLLGFLCQDALGFIAGTGWSSCVLFLTG